MARRSKHENLKPEVLRLLSEGFKPSEIQVQFPDLPQRTLYDWAKEFRNSCDNGGRQRLPIDPESPIDRIINGLWDVIKDPAQPGANTMVNAFNALIRAEQLRADQYAALDFENMSDEELERIAKNVP